MNKISVILPVYNGEKYIQEALKSVLDQSCYNLELLVIDDGSADNTRAIVNGMKEQDTRIRYVRNEKNMGVQKTLNRGLHEAQGEYIARIDDDDEWADPQKLERQLAFFNEHSDYVLLGTGVIVVNEAGREIARFLNPETDEEIRRRMLTRNCFSHSSVMFRKEAALRFGGYDESLETLHAEDYDLWLKLGTVGKLANLPFYGLRFTERAGISNLHRMAQFRSDLYLAKKYRMQYPNYWFALVTNVLRISFWKFYRLLPRRLKKRLFVFYKKYWNA